MGEQVTIVEAANGTLGHVKLELKVLEEIIEKGDIPVSLNDIYYEILTQCFNEQQTLEEVGSMEI